MACRGNTTKIEQGKEHGGAFRHVQHPDFRYNPPFNDSDWLRKDGDVRRQNGETDSSSLILWR